MKLRVFLTAVPLVLLAACDNATTGTVTSRQHTPEYTAYDLLCMAYNQNGFCSVQVPMPRTVPECWQVNFHNEHDDENGSACVDPADYELYRLGDQYPRVGAR